MGLRWVLPPDPPVWDASIDPPAAAPQQLPLSATASIPHSSRATKSPQILNVEHLPGDHLHQLYLIQRSDGSTLILKAPPHDSIRLLTSEQVHPWNEAAALSLLRDTHLPIPPRRSLSWHQDTPIGDDSTASPLLAMEYLPGLHYAQIKPHLNLIQRSQLVNDILTLRSHISSYIFPAFGPLAHVLQGHGHPTWRSAFTDMLVSLLTDGQDMLVQLPYTSLHMALRTWGDCFDEVTQSKLVLPDLNKAENILLQESKKGKGVRISGLLDFGRSLCGDAEMGDIGIADVDTDQVLSASTARRLLYTVYEATYTILQQHCRSIGDGEEELDARRVLTTTLQRLDVD